MAKSGPKNHRKPGAIGKTAKNSQKTPKNGQKMAKKWLKLPKMAKIG